MFKRIVPLLYLEPAATRHSEAIDLGADNALRVEGLLINSSGSITSANSVTVAVEVSNDSVNWGTPPTSISFSLEANPAYGSADSGTSKLLSRFVRLSFTGSTTGTNIVSAWLNTSRSG